MVILLEIVKVNYLETTTHYQERPLQKTSRPLTLPAFFARKGNGFSISYLKLCCLPFHPYG